MTTYEYILSKRKAKKYEVVDVNLGKEKIQMEEVPLEEIFEPYIDNPEFNGTKSLHAHKDSAATVVPLNWSDLQRYASPNYQMQHISGVSENSNENVSEKDKDFKDSEKFKSNMDDTTYIDKSDIAL